MTHDSPTRRRLCDLPASEQPRYRLSQRGATALSSAELLARLQAMLDTRALLVGLLRGRLRQRHPDLPERELSLKLLEEIEGARDSGTRPESLPGYPA